MKTNVFKLSKAYISARYERLLLSGHEQALGELLTEQGSENCITKGCKLKSKTKVSQ